MTTPRTSALIKQRISELLTGPTTQNQIAHALGYPLANNVSMQKNARAPVPLVKLPDYARVLGLDLGVLFRLWLEDQEWPPAAVHEMVSERVVTRQERAYLDVIRQIATAEDSHA